MGQSEMQEVPETPCKTVAESNSENVSPGQPETKAVITKTTRKPKLKHRPANGTILSIPNFDSSLSLTEQKNPLDMDDLSFLHHGLMNSKKIIMVTGAGISVAAGIPDFRSSNGLFQGLCKESGPGGGGKELFDMNVYRSDEQTGKFHRLMRELYFMSKELKPSKFHNFLNDLSKSERLMRLYTQNIDCFDTQLSHLETQVPIRHTPPFPKTIQLHGTIQIMYCSKCRWQGPFNPQLFESNETPHCPECKELEEVRMVVGKRSQGIGCLRPRVVLYNEFHPDGEIIGQVSHKDLNSKPDALIMVGTSLKIPGVKRLVKELSKSIHSRKGCIIWINTEPPPLAIVDYIQHIDLIVTADCQSIPDLMQKYKEEVVDAKKVKKKSALVQGEKKEKKPNIKEKKNVKIQATLTKKGNLVKGNKILKVNKIDPMKRLKKALQENHPILKQEETINEQKGTEITSN